MNQATLANMKWRLLLVGCGFAVFFSITGLLRADGPVDTLNGEWERLLAAKRDFYSMEPPSPGSDEFEHFLAEASLKAGEIADQFKKYQQRTDSSHRNEAWHEWMDFLAIAAHWNATRRAELEQVERQFLADPRLSARQRSTIRINQIERMSDLRAKESLVRQVRGEIARIQKDLPPGDPGRNFRFSFEAYLMEIAAWSEPEDARRLVAEIMRELPPGHLDFQAAKRLQGQLERVGQKLDLRFTDLSGETMDLADYLGKVVLLDFWATWCPPCVAGIPKVDSLWKTLRQEGLEVIGIGYDSDREVLERFLKRNELVWPQFFSEEGPDAPLVQSLGQPGPPAYWLVDRRGVLVDINAFNDLEQKVGRLLSTNAPVKVDTAIE
ncbi:MAG: TlpA family protein disulfide reductase [Nitrospira sp.]|nr:TlpA family protein disulfide reductase [Nitrospira sp.]